MDNYVVSARKYRPQGFEEVVGQTHITTTLQNAIENNHLAQALLFCGPRGVGKTTCARIVAKLVNEAENEDTETALNIFELDAASNNSVDDIRNLIDQVRYPPQYGKYKIYIIDEVHMLSNQAFNAFLKTLEEPPPYAIFILATTEKHKVIPTILSRCQIYDFNRIQISDISDHLKEIAAKEGIEAEDEALHLIAQKADGALRDALSIFDLIVTFSANNSVTYADTIKNLHVLDYEYYFRLTEHLLNEHLSEALLVFDEIIKEGFDGHDFVAGLANHFRDLMMCKDNATVELLEVSDSVKSLYTKQANSAPMSFLMNGMNLLAKCDLEYKSRKNQRLHVELTLMKIGYVNAAVAMTQLEGDSDHKKKKLKSPPHQDPKSNSNVKKTSSFKKEKSELEQPPEIEQGDAETVELNKGEKVEKPIGKPTPPPEKKATTRIPSIAAIKNKIVAEPDIKDNVSEIEHDVVLKQELFTTEELDAAWEKFKEIKQKDGKDQEVALLNQTYILKDNTITINSTNDVFTIIFNDLKADMQIFLRKELRNGKIKLAIETMELDESKMIYTNREKFNHLIEKYPDLKILKDKLGLDTDF